MTVLIYVSKILSQREPKLCLSVVGATRW